MEARRGPASQRTGSRAVEYRARVDERDLHARNSQQVQQEEPWTGLEVARRGRLREGSGVEARREAERWEDWDLEDQMERDVSLQQNQADGDDALRGCLGKQMKGKIITYGIRRHCTQEGTKESGLAVVREGEWVPPVLEEHVRV